MYTARQPRAERTCPTCHKVFSALASDIRRGNSTYCSRACFGGPRVSRICPICRRAFTTPQSEIDRGSGTYCSTRCYHIGKMRPLSERFWGKVQKTDGCWLWTGAQRQRGYGVIGTGTRHGRTVPAHRVSWELHHGPIPPGLYILHQCDNPPCVRPDHLFLGTLKDNTQDMLKKGRHLDTFTEEQKREIRRRYAIGGISQTALAHELSVGQTTISRIIRADR